MLSHVISGALIGGFILLALVAILKLGAAPVVQIPTPLSPIVAKAPEAAHPPVQHKAVIPHHKRHAHARMDPKSSHHRTTVPARSVPCVPQHFLLKPDVTCGD